MKKITNIFVTLAAVAMALVSCNKNENVPSTQDIHFTIYASAPQTRTYLDNQLDGNYKVGWNADDKIALFLGTIDGNTTKATAVFQNTAGKAERATFEGTASISAGEGTFVALYPAAKFVKGYANGAVGVELLATQQPSSESFDPLADILAAPSFGFVSDATNVEIDDVYFKRVMSVVKVNLKGSYAAGDIVKNFTMTSAGHFAEDGTTVVPDTLAGRAAINLETQKIVKWNTNTNSVKAIPTENVIVDDDVLNAIYLVVNPTTIVAGTEVTFQAETDKHEINKTVTLTKDLSFPQGNIAVINLNITEADCSDLVDTDYSGDYLMTGTYTKDGVTTTYAGKAWVSGNANIRTSAVTVNTDETVSVTDVDHKFTFTKVASGDYEGMYTIQDANGLYLFAASDSANQLKAEEEPDVNAYWTVKANEDGTYAISAEKSSNRNVLEFNPNNGSPIISCYSNSATSRQSVKLYPFANVVIPSVFTVEAVDALTVAATAVSVQFTVTANVPWEATLDEAYNGVTLSPASGSSSATVTLSFPANTETTAKEYIVYFNAEGFSEFEFTVNQAGAQAYANDGSLEHPYSASEASALALGGDTGSYYIYGTVTKIQNQYSASYGTANFWIDENGESQSIFEGYKIKYLGNVNWVDGNAEIAVGDEVVIYGKLTIYNSTTPETSSGYLVSLNGKTKGLNPGTLTATPDDDNKQITVTWGAATGSESTITYVVTCDTQTYTANAAGSHTFTMSDYGVYNVSVVASAEDAVSATAKAVATLSNPSGETQTLQYTLDGTDSTQGTNAYATESDITQNSISWKATANTNISPWRFGGKNLTGVDRAVYSTTPLSSNISSIEVESGTATLTVNSLTISVHDSAADAASGSNPIATKTVTSGITSSTVILSKADQTSWAEKYYRIVYNVTTSGTSNQYVQFKSAKFNGTN